MRGRCILDKLYPAARMALGLCLGEVRVAVVYQGEFRVSRFRGLCGPQGDATVKFISRCPYISNLTIEFKNKKNKMS